MFVNVNIGIPTNDMEIASIIEKELEVYGIYYDNDGSNSDTYNINAGFTDRTEADLFVDKWNSQVYIETETFEQ